MQGLLAWLATAFVVIARCQAFYFCGLEEVDKVGAALLYDVRLDLLS